MYEVKRGRPADTEGRTEKEMRVYGLLDRLGIEYSRIDHEKTDTMEACAGIDEALGVRICKNLFLCNRQKTEFYLLMMPGDKPFKTKELSSQLGVARLSFGSPEDMERLLDVTPGSASVMGLMNDTEKRVRLLIDTEVLTGEFIGCHPCVNTASLKIATKDIVDIFVPETGHFVTEVTLVGE